MALHKHEIKAPAGRAALIPEDFVGQVNDRADLLEIIGRSVKLRKTGANYFGLCPFHKEKSPSFSVSPDKGFYKCFGCGAAGGALTFLMEHDGTPFRDAVMELATDAGLALPPEMVSEGGVSTPAVETGPIYRAMDTAAKYFAHVLRHSPSAIAYLKKRGLNNDSLKRFVIGMAPDEWRGLKEAFPDYESNAVILLAALIREKEGKEAGSANRYDTFRNRITFGVRDTRGRIIAFGARVLEGGGDPKYLNSPESPVFHKSGALFGLFEAREAIRTKKIAIVVEGYMDVVMLAQAGVENSVASMGTAFTRAHAERLLTQSDCIVFAFDGDAAGRTAANRALETILPLVEDHHDLRFLILPDGKDPDDLAREEGAAAFDARVRLAPSMSEFLISEISLKNNGLKSTEDRARFAQEASTLANKIGYRTKLRALVLEQISVESRIPGSAIVAIRRAAQTTREQWTLWSRIAEAARIAPAEAIQQRDVVIELLDPDDASEAQLIQVLQSVTSDPETELPADDNRRLLARDVMLNCVDLITEHREAQIRSELRAQFNSGQINEREYMRLSLLQS